MIDRPALAAQAERLLGQRLRAGDESALGEVYDQFGSFVFGLALRVIGDRTAAEDVAQDVFVGLWERPDGFDPDRGSMRAYLGTLTHRRSVDLIRREEARRRREDKTAAEPDRRAAGRRRRAGRRGLGRGAQRRRLAPARPSARRSSWPTSRATPTGRWRWCSGIPEGTAKSRLRLALARVAELVTPDLSEQWA